MYANTAGSDCKWESVGVGWTSSHAIRAWNGGGFRYYYDDLYEAIEHCSAEQTSIEMQTHTTVRFGNSARLALSLSLSVSASLSLSMSVPSVIILTIYFAQLTQLPTHTFITHNFRVAAPELNLL